jgi:hypothetical protein
MVRIVKFGIEPIQSIFIINGANPNLKVTANNYRNKPANNSTNKN